MDRQAELSIIRAAYAKQILAAAWIMDNARLEAALSATRREDFLGAGPWWILRRFGDYVTTPDADPVYLYTATTSCMSEPAPAITPPSWLTSLDHQAGLPE